MFAPARWPLLVCASLAPEKMRLDAVLRGDEVTQMAEYMHQYGLIDSVPPVERLVDLSYLNEAIEDAK